jgi:hypothetical protein
MTKSDLNATIEVISSVSAYLGKSYAGSADNLYFWDSLNGSIEYNPATKELWILGNLGLDYDEKTITSLYGVAYLYSLTVEEGHKLK